MKKICANPECGKEFKGRKTSKYCSLVCYINNTYTESKKYTKTCINPDCQKMFQTNRKEQNYCHRQCYLSHHKKTIIVNSFNLDDMKSEKEIKDFLFKVKKYNLANMLGRKKLQEVSIKLKDFKEKSKKTNNDFKYTDFKIPENPNPVTLKKSDLIPIVSKDGIDPWNSSPSISNVTGWLEAWLFEYDNHKDNTPIIKYETELKEIGEFCKGIQWKKGRTNKDLETGQRIFKQLSDYL